MGGNIRRSTRWLGASLFGGTISQANCVDSLSKYRQQICLIIMQQRRRPCRATSYSDNRHHSGSRYNTRAAVFNQVASHSHVTAIPSAMRSTFLVARPRISMSSIKPGIHAPRELQDCHAMPRQVTIRRCMACLHVFCTPSVGWNSECTQE